VLRCTAMHKLRNMLSQLRVFDAVARTGGVTRAAEILCVTPSAVSQQLKQLESALGIELARKEGRELELSEAGRQLARRVADAFDRIDNALTEATEQSQAKRLRLKIPPSLAIRWLLPRLPDFYARHDDIEVQVGTTSQAQDFQLEQADFVVRHGVGQWTDVVFDHLFDDALVPVCSPAMAADITKPANMLDAKLLHSMMRPTAWSIWFASAGLMMPAGGRQMQFGNAALCYQAAADGVGVAIAQEAYITDDLRQGRLVAPVDHVARTPNGYYLVCDPLKVDRYPLRVFREWIRSCR
jgi:DNA-binding transcriptional LysR family regulator